jgi:hypothetical protein
VSTRSPACKPAIRFASFSGEADSGCWWIGRFLTRTTHEQWGWCGPSRGLTAHLVKLIKDRASWFNPKYRAPVFTQVRPDFYRALAIFAQ